MNIRFAKRSGVSNVSSSQPHRRAPLTSLRLHAKPSIGRFGCSCFGLPIFASMPSQSRTNDTSPNGTPVCAMPYGPGFMPTNMTSAPSSPYFFRYMRCASSAYSSGLYTCVTGAPKRSAASSSVIFAAMSASCTPESLTTLRLFFQVDRLLHPMLLRIEVGEGGGERGIVPALGDPGRVVQVAQPAQRLDEREPARIELAELVVRLDEDLALLRALFVATADEQP